MGFLLTFLLAFSAAAMAENLDFYQYPDERVYGENDRGFAQYQAPSIHGTGQFALTYDDGPHVRFTPRLLDILKAYQVKATFFIVTSRINAQTAPILKRMLDEGHIIASHGREHLNSNQIDLRTWRQNLVSSMLALKEVYQKAGHDWTSFYYRFPYAAYGAHPDYHHMNALQDVSRDLFGDNCLQFAFWDVDSSDWVPGMTPQNIFQTLRAHQEGGTYFGFRTVRNTQGQTTYVKVPRTLEAPPQGGVVLLHDIHERTIEATRLYLQYAQRNNLRVVTLPEIQEYAVKRECRFL